MNTSRGDKPCHQTNPTVLNELLKTDTPTPINIENTNTTTRRLDSPTREQLNHLVSASVSSKPPKYTDCCAFSRRVQLSPSVVLSCFISNCFCQYIQISSSGARLVHKTSYINVTLFSGIKILITDTRTGLNGYFKLSRCCTTL